MIGWVINTPLICNFVLPRSSSFLEFTNLQDKARRVGTYNLLGKGYLIHQQTETAISGVLSKIVFLKISQCSQENACVGVSFGACVAGLNPIQDGEGQKAPHTSFSPVTSTNLGIIPQNFLILVLTLLPQWCNISRPYLEPVPHY